MCGIVGYVGPKNAVPLLIEGLKRLEYRGYDSAGVAVRQADGALAIRKRVGRLANLEEALEAAPVAGGLGIVTGGSATARETGARGLPRTSRIA